MATGPANRWIAVNTGPAGADAPAREAFARFAELNASDGRMTIKVRWPAGIWRGRGAVSGFDNQGPTASILSVFRLNGGSCAGPVRSARTVAGESVTPGISRDSDSEGEAPASGSLG